VSRMARAWGAGKAVAVRGAERSTRSGRSRPVVGGVAGCSGQQAALQGVWGAGAGRAASLPLPFRPQALRGGSERAWGPGSVAAAAMGRKVCEGSSASALRVRVKMPRWP